MPTTLSANSMEEGSDQAAALVTTTPRLASRRTTRKTVDRRDGLSPAPALAPLAVAPLAAAPLAAAPLVAAPLLAGGATIVVADGIVVIEAEATTGGETVAGIAAATDGRRAVAVAEAAAVPRTRRRRIAAGIEAAPGRRIVRILRTTAMGVAVARTIQMTRRTGIRRRAAARRKMRRMIGIKGSWSTSIDAGMSLSGWPFGWPLGDMLGRGRTLGIVRSQLGEQVACVCVGVRFVFLCVRVRE